jgi:hypothetical protein
VYAHVWYALQLRSNASPIGVLLLLLQVAATQGMYDVSSVPADSQLWQLIALCAGKAGRHDDMLDCICWQRHVQLTPLQAVQAAGLLHDHAQ